LAISGAAFAQVPKTVVSADEVAEPRLDESSLEQGESAERDKDEIVVTGTLIRGVAPVGSNVLSVGKADIDASGASSTTQLLATIPQLASYFNGLPQIGSGEGGGLQILRPNLRNLPSSNTASGGSTLLLVDGHRIVASGVDQYYPDPETVPADVLERVEVVTDGGSATYGTDAIGGVINYITRRRFDGIRVRARAGYAEDYFQWDASVIAGKDWGTGSFYVSYSHNEHDEVFGRDRDYVRAIDTTTGIPVGRTCSNPNVTNSSIVYGVTGGALVAGAPNSCDLSDNRTIYPKEKRDAVFVGFSQDVTDKLKVDIRGYWNKRSSLSFQSPGSSGNVPVGQFYRPTTPARAGNDRLEFDFIPVFGTGYRNTTNHYEQWGITPQITYDVDTNWQVRLMANYGHSNSSYITRDLNPTLITAGLTSASAATAINPYNIAATPRSILDAIQNYQTVGEAASKLLQTRLLVDGRLFSLPGGDLRIALGAEYMKDDFRRRGNISGPVGPITAPFQRYSRNVKSVFGEIQIPIFGNDNAMPLFHSLNISAAARYDSYSDFGGTFNPRFGITWEPVEWISLRGNWGKAFNAPTPLDLAVGAPTFGTVTQASASGLAGGGYIVDPANPPVPNTTYAGLILSGAKPGLQPQKATVWSIGATIDPPVVPGLRASLTYFNINFANILGKPSLFGSFATATTFPGSLVVNPTDAQIAAFLADVPNDPAAQAYANPGTRPLPVYELIDFRTNNFGDARVRGLDFSLNYQAETKFGSVDFGFSGNQQLKYESRVVPSGPYTDQLFSGQSLFRATGSVGATFGKFRAQATLVHTGGYRLGTPTTGVGQVSVDPYNVVNLYFRHLFEGQGAFNDVELSLNVNNLFGTAPPVILSTNGSSNGYANGATLGRFVQLGLAKKF
jgi:iron complex outermembrane receptor protein